MDVAPLITSTRSMTLGSMVRRSRCPFIKGVDCGIPSIKTSTDLPRSVCPEFVALLVDVPRPGTVFPKIVERLVLIWLWASISFVVKIVTEEGTVEMLSGLRPAVTIISSNTWVELS
ncbi:hypothetical protein D3C81_876030 [compost metagenome]